MLCEGEMLFGDGKTEVGQKLARVKKRWEVGGIEHRENMLMED